MHIAIIIPILGRESSANIVRKAHPACNVIAIKRVQISCHIVTIKTAQTASDISVVERAHIAKNMEIRIPRKYRKYSAH